MNSESIDGLLERLCRGDADAAEQVFLAFEPYLRMVVRRQLTCRLRAKFDSTDIVQSIWTDLLDGFRGAGWRFTDADHLRAFLVKATRNRLIDRVRQYRSVSECESPLSPTRQECIHSCQEPQPSETVKAKDLWEKILALCPPAHHELLRLKRDGISLDDIAVRVGLHKSSVRRILYELARRLAAKSGTFVCARAAPPANRT